MSSPLRSRATQRVRTSAAPEGPPAAAPRRGLTGHAGGVARDQKAARCVRRSRKPDRLMEPPPRSEYADDSEKSGTIERSQTSLDAAQRETLAHRAKQSRPSPTIISAKDEATRSAYRHHYLIVMDKSAADGPDKPREALTDGNRVTTFHFYGPRGIRAIDPACRRKVETLPRSAVSSKLGNGNS